MISSSSFLWHFQGFLCIVSCHVQTECFTSFPIWIPSISFYFLVAMTRTSKAMLNNSGESGHCCLVLDLRGRAFSFYHWEWYLLWFCHLWPLLCSGIYSFCAYTLESYYCEWVLSFVKSFLCIYWDYHMVFIFQFVNMVYHIDLCILKNPCIPGINPAWSWCIRFLMCCWILFAKILLRTFTSMFISDIGLWCSFLCVIFVWFWYQGDGSLIEWVWKCSFLCNFLKEF